MVTKKKNRVFIIFNVVHSGDVLIRRIFMARFGCTCILRCKLLVSNKLDEYRAGGFFVEAQSFMMLRYSTCIFIVYVYLRYSIDRVKMV